MSSFCVTGAGSFKFIMNLLSKLFFGGLQKYWVVVYSAEKKWTAINTNTFRNLASINAGNIAGQ